MYNTKSHLIRQNINTSFKQLIEQFTTKKNTHISFKFIEDLVVNRLSDFSIPIIWDLMINNFSLCSYTFMRGELSRYDDDSDDDYDYDDSDDDDDL